jgi:hypothetical protein
MKTLKHFLEEIEPLDEKNVPTSPEKWAKAKSAAKSKFAVYPSAYANAWASKKYKSMGGGWKSVSENHIAIAMGKMLDDEGSMVLNQLDDIDRCSKLIRDYIGTDYEKQLPAWVQSKVTLAADYIDTVGLYLSTKNESVEELFDIVESIVNGIAEENNIDPEILWENLEDVSDEELYEVAVLREKEECGACMDHEKDGEAVRELKAALLAHKKEINAVKDNPDKVYDIINRLMTSIAKSHNISGQKMHDMWVDKYKEVPDTWIMEDANGYKNPTGGLTQKGRDHYNRETGGHLKAPVTTPPSKLKAGSKAANRRKSFCARMSGVKGPMTKPNGKPSRKALALRKWNC